MRFVKFLWWALSAALFLACLTLPVSPEAQIMMSAGCILLVGFVKSVQPYGLARIIAMCFATAVIIRYVFWRTTQTLPPMNDLTSFVPGLLLYGAEMYSVLMLTLSLFVITRPQHERPTPEFSDEEAPTVDVFIPSYNEPPELLAKTIMAATRMEYPEGRFKVWLLDDGGTDQKCESDDPTAAGAARERRALLQRMCAELGAGYLTRARNVSAKAGNLNSGLENTSADLVVVFDADHAPSPEFLRRTVGFFLADERVALVQTPHFFINPDPIERNLRLVGRAPSESEMFYGKVQHGLDFRGGAFFCGSGAVLRRSALAEVGGFAGRSITEDCESTVALHARGWKSLYVGRVMIAGLQPETFSSFIQQRSRWAQGMIQILLLARPWARRGLTMSQRLCYLSSIMFWVFPISRLMFLLAPTCYLLFDLKIFTASGEDFLAYTASYVAANLVLQNLLYGDVRRPWMSEVYEFAQSIHLGRALFAVLLNPTKPTFKVTSKDEVADEDKLSDIGGVFYWLFAALVALQAWAVYRITQEPHNTNLLMAVSVWNALNIMLAGTALGAVNERRSVKPTIDVRRPGFIVSPDGRREEVKIISADDDGVMISALGAFPGGEIIRLAVPETHRQSATGELSCRLVVRGPATGGSFRGEYVPGVDALALGCSLMYDNPEKWRKYDMSKRPRGVIMGTMDFIALSLRETVRGLTLPLSPKRKRGAGA